jgi:outer membrane protein OmpA-like peptidoglycan-associated protein
MFISKLKIVVVLFSLLIFAHNSTVRSQEKITDGRELTIIKKGDNAYQKMQYVLATTYYSQYVKQTSSKNVSINILHRLADSQWKSRQLADCLATYKRLFTLIRTESLFAEKEKLRISELYARAGDPEEASRWLKDIPGYEKKASAYTNILLKNEMIKDSDCWKIWPLKSIAGYRVFAPVLVDSVLVFSGVALEDAKDATVQQNVLYKLETNKQHPDTKTLIKEKPAWKIFYKNSVKRRHLANVYEGSDVRVTKRAKYVYFNKQNTMNQDTLEAISINSLDGGRSQFTSIAIDKNKRTYFSLPNEDRKGLHLEQGEYDGQGIQNAQKIQFNNWDSRVTATHPAINRKGNLLVFSSSLDDALTDYDLYYSYLDSVTKKWTPPKPLTILNTTGNEIFPNITADDFLYFSSDNMPGLGGFDIYRIKLNDALKNTGTIEHLSYPINSSSDDYGWAQYPDNVSGYFTSDRNQSIDNIYGFKYTPKITISGSVTNQLTQTPIKRATIFAYNTITGKVTVVKADSLGHYMLRVEKGSDVVIRSVINPYDTVFANSTTNEFSKPVVIHGNEDHKEIKTLYVNQLGKNVSWVLDTIFYDFNKWNIRSESYKSLDRIVNLLKKYPLVRVEVASYTDSRGSDTYNLWLSQQRANSAAQYMVNAGIYTERILGRGYGKAHANKLEGQISNRAEIYRLSRRTEVKIAGYYTNIQSVKEKIFDWTKFKENELVDISAFPQGFFKEDTIENGNSPSVNKAERLSSMDSSRMMGQESSESATQDKMAETTNSLSPKKLMNTLHPIVVKIEGYYCIQVGVFSTLSNANRLIAKLENFVPKLLQCFVLESEASSFKVYVGHFDTYKETRPIVMKIEKAFSR